MRLENLALYGTLVLSSSSCSQLPPGMSQAMGQSMAPDGGGGWISPNSHSQTNSPRYSPDPNELPASAGFSINSMGMVGLGVEDWLCVWVWVCGCERVCVGVGVYVCLSKCVCVYYMCVCDSEHIR